MNAIREIKKVKNGKVEIELPKDFNGNNVEIIILMNTQDVDKNIKKGKRKNEGRSLGGILHKYTNPNLIPKEKDAWPNAVKDKHGLH
ncbi:MAG: hypothetical protein M3R36_01450 [Bacteroidota bacterium]|nr:hypothetical protein [Bacteroidota bacterium]